MIQQSYLNEVANKVHTDIAKVVINDTVEITAFQVKQLTASTVRLEFIIPQGSVPNVTKIQLRKSNNAIIRSSSVFIPITSDTLIKHNITVSNKGA